MKAYNTMDNIKIETEFEIKIKTIIEEYKLNVDREIVKCKLEKPNYRIFSLTIRYGDVLSSTEGFNICIIENSIEYILKVSNKNEALKVLEVMLMLFPDN